jgi:beta-galactosidase/beta-glucuronidase
MDAAHGYPRPQLRRGEWQSLNGEWQFAIDRDGRADHPHDVRWSARIRVPFAPETTASGIGDTGLYRVCWYRREFPVPSVSPLHRVHLHFGAVDYSTTVWVNGHQVGTHQGGYTPFWFDITDHLRETARCVVVVRAEDDPADLAKPRGKQDWEREPHSIWYERTTGIWQTVWLEVVPATHIRQIRWTPNLERWEIGCAVWVEGALERTLHLDVRLDVDGVTLSDDSYLVISGEVHRRIGLSDPGVDDYRNSLLWDPQRPRLVDAQMRLRSGEAILDEVASYTALRSVMTEGDRFILNGRPFSLRLVLDQGYWPETGLTAPDDAAFRRDVELVKSMGFNGVRKHQKLENPRYLYWADRLGLLVWAEMPSCYRFTHHSIERAALEWIAAITRDYSHPCIAAWVPFNESWGVPNLPNSPAERHYVQALYHLTKTLDPTRPVVGNDGWESVATDIIGIHDYDPDPRRIAARYHIDESRPRLFARERPGGRLLVLDGEQHGTQPLVLTEFGGISADHRAGTWGYSQVESVMRMAEAYETLMTAVRATPMFAGFCYTQFADTYQETNGLLYSDRRPKFPIAEIARATCGFDPSAPVSAPDRSGPE